MGGIKIPRGVSSCRRARALLLPPQPDLATTTNLTSPLLSNMSTVPAPTTPPAAEPSTETEAPSTTVEGSTSESALDVAPPSVTMPDSSIAAAQAALNNALEAAAIVPDENELPAGSQAGDVEADGGPKTVFDDANSFNVKVSDHLELTTESCIITGLTQSLSSSCSTLCTLLGRSGTSPREPRTCPRRPRLR